MISIFILKNTINNTGTGLSHLLNCINSIDIVKDHLIFSRITYLAVFIQSYMLLNITENARVKCQFGELKSCYPMTT